MKLHIDCNCGSAEHQFSFVYDEDVWLEVHLSQCLNIFQRLYHAIKFIFGYRCRYGNWDCILVDKTDRERIIKFLEDTLK